MEGSGVLWSWGVGFWGVPDGVFCWLLPPKPFTRSRSPSALGELSPKYEVREKPCPDDSRSGLKSAASAKKLEESLVGVSAVAVASAMRSAASVKGISLLLGLKMSAESKTALPWPELEESRMGVSRGPPSSPPLPMWCWPWPPPLPLPVCSGKSDRISVMSGPMLSELDRRTIRGGKAGCCCCCCWDWT